MIIINLYCGNIGVGTWCFYCLFLLQSMNKDFFDSLVRPQFIILLTNECTITMKGIMNQ